MIEKLIARFKQEPVAVVGIVAAIVAAANEAVVASVDPSDGWKPVALAIAVAVARQLVTPTVKAQVESEAQEASDYVKVLGGLR